MGRGTPETAMGGTLTMADETDAATLTAVLHEEEALQARQAAAEAGDLLPDDLLPGVGRKLTPPRDGRASGGLP